MGKKKKIFSVLIGILFLVGTLFALSLWAEKKLVAELDSKFDNALQYENIDVDLLRGRILFEAPQLRLENFRMKLDKLEIDGFGYFEFLKNDRISIGTLRAERPEIIFFTKNSDTSATSTKFKSQFLINNLEIKDGTLELAETDSTAAFFFFQMRELQLKEVEVNQKTLQEKIPFAYDTYKIFSDSIFLNLDKQHSLSLGNLALQDGGLRAKNLRVIPRFSKAEFQEQIPFEKDRFDLLVQKIDADNIRWDFLNDSLYLRNETLRIEGADLQVYRDKLLPDDTRTKTLYSEKIRNLPFKIGIGKLEVISSRLVYEERTRETMDPALVNFTNLYATVSGLTNIGMNLKDFPNTIADAKANLMGESVLNFHLLFNVSDLQNPYSFSGNIGPVSSEGINNFLRPALNIEAEGGIESLAFDFTGDAEGATGEMQLNYRDFKVTVLRDDGKKKDGILTAIANFFINNKALNEEAIHEDLMVTRDKTKSFWNLVWSCIEEGAFKTLL